MNKQELGEWFKIVHYEGDAFRDVDPNNGNCEEERVFLHPNGKRYVVCFCNDVPSFTWDTKNSGYIKDVYEPKEVIKKTKRITKTYYEYVEEN